MGAVNAARRYGLEIIPAQELERKGPRSWERTFRADKKGARMNKKCVAVIIAQALQVFI